jgi:hypothetical protein
MPDFTNPPYNPGVHANHTRQKGSPGRWHGTAEAVVRAVVLDVDDTLVQTEAACFEIENQVLHRLGRAPIPRRLHLDTWGQPLRAATEIRSPGVDVAAFLDAFGTTFGEYLAAGLVDVVPAESTRRLPTQRSCWTKGSHPA